MSRTGVGPALAQPEKVVAHKRLLDELATAGPILPLRFGTVLAGPDDVADLLLRPGHDTFRAALARLEGCAQYVVNGRYAEEAVLREVLAENPEAEELRADVNSVADSDATLGLRIRLGQIVSHALAAKRMADTDTLADVVAPCCVASSARLPAHPHDAAFLDRRGDAGMTRLPQRRVEADPESVERSLVALVPTIVELLRQLMERQALRRIDRGDLTDEQVDTIGMTLIALDERMSEPRAHFGLTPEDLNLDLGPLGPLLPRE